MLIDHKAKLDDKELERQFAQLLDPQELRNARKAAEQSASQFTMEQYKLMRKMAKTDLFFLANTVLGYNKLSEDLHGHMCAWLQATDGKQFREELMPRGHFKSTIITIADSIRIALPDDDGNEPWPRCLGTNARVLIGHETHEAASRFLVSITSHFLSNPLLMGLFPECVPDPRRNRVNRNELELPRTEIWSEPTFDTMGVGGRGQGRHYNFLKLDDLFGDKARDSEAERLATYTWFDNIQSFFSTFDKDAFDLTGTRWGFDDLYAHAHEMYGDLLIKYIRSCEEPHPTEKVFDPVKKKLIPVEYPIFPEMFPTEKLAILKKNPKIYDAQYRNNPGEGMGLFEKGWKRTFKQVDRNTLEITHKVYVFGQPENLGRVINEKVNIRDLDIIFLIDPAMSGLGGYIITGMDRRSRIFTLKAKKGSWKPPDFVEEFFADVTRWRPRMAAIEAVTFSEIYRHWIQKEMRTRNTRLTIEDAKTRNRTKDERINGLSNWYSAGLIHYEENQTDIDHEHDTFGASQQIHLLDALAYGPEYWKLPVISSNQESIKKQEQELLAERDIATGYSA